MQGVSLTVGAAVHLHPETQPAAGVPVQRDETQETGSHRVGQLVLDDSLRIHVPHERLRDQTERKITVLGGNYAIKVNLL